MRKNAFTIIEVLIAMVLIAVAIVSLLVSNGALTRANGYGTELSTAEFLIEQIRELTSMLPAVDPQTGHDYFGLETSFGETTLDRFDDVDDFYDSFFQPPIASDRTQLTDFSAYGQRIIVKNVNASNFEQDELDSNYTGFFKVTVYIYLNNNYITSASWIRADY